jgi:hypothetical protein
MKKGKTIFTYEPIGETFNVIYRNPKFNSKPELSINQLNNNIYFKNHWLLHKHGYRLISQLKS